ncbi:MAG TPA: hypothetical protein VGM81_20355 [Burkholderiaceae bacterium]|jgi:hypothetical protein
MRFRLKRILAWMPGGFLVVFSRVEIETEDEQGLVLDADGWRVAFDKRSQVVARSGRTVVSFSSVNSIDVKHFVNGKRMEWWVLSLALRGGRRITIGRSANDAQVSIAAAHIAGVTGKPVRVVGGVGL